MKFDKFEKQLLRQWREELKVGDHVDIYHRSKDVLTNDIWFEDTALTEIEPLRANPDLYKQYEIENMFIKNGTIGTNAVNVFPVGYKPGDMTKKHLSPDTRQSFDDLINSIL
jgi:hypothetical protein